MNNNNDFAKKKYNISNTLCSKKVLLISGITCVVPFIFSEVFFVSWFSFIVVFLMFLKQNQVEEKSGKVFRSVFLFSYAYYFFGYIWLLNLYPLDFAGFSNIESVFIVAAAIFLIPAIHGVLFSGVFTVVFAISKRLKFLDITMLVIFPCIFVFTEYLQSLGTFAFPWLRIFITQTDFLPVLQSASVFGSYFITYFILLINTLIGYGIVNKSSRKTVLIFAVSLFTVNLIFGLLRINYLNNKIEKSEKITAIALQANIPSAEKWNTDTSDMLDVYFELADNALLEVIQSSENNRGTIILTPETAITSTIYESGYYSKKISSYAKNNNVIFAAGCFSDNDGIDGNSIILFDKNGMLEKPYNKQKLAPFGEILPYSEFLDIVFPSLSDMNVIGEQLYVGKNAEVFRTDFASFGGLICYDSIFPDLARKSVNYGAEILLIATNDSWFGNSAALQNHFSHAKMRCIENGVSAVRSANTGISAMILPTGEAICELGASQKGFLTAKLPVLNENTLYTKVGEIWVGFCALLICFSALNSALKITKG